MWKRTLAGSTLPYSQRSALILSRRSYLMEQVRLCLDSHQHRWSTGETQVTRFLQVGDDAALVPQQAAVAQFDGGNELGSTGLRLVTGWKENTTLRFVSRHFCICYVDGRQFRQIPQEYGGPLWKWTKLRTKLTKITSNNKSKPHTSVWFCSKSASISCRTCRSPSSWEIRTSVSFSSVMASLVNHIKLNGIFCLAQLMWSAHEICVFVLVFK